MTETPKCEHCDQPLHTVYVKTSTFRTYVPELGEYLNLEKNWDGEGEIWTECTQCKKETDKTRWTDDGRLIPASKHPQAHRTTCEGCADTASPFNRDSSYCSGCPNETDP